MLRRSLTVLVTAGLLATALPAAPATAADRPALVNEHTSWETQTVYELSSSAAGTVYGAADQFVRLLRAPVTPDATPVTLQTGRVAQSQPAQRATIVGDLVAIPAGDTVRWCLVATCPALSTLTVPAGHRYLGNAGDVAVLFAAETNTLALQPWAGGDAQLAQLVPLGDVTVASPTLAQGDAAGITVSNASASIYVARPSLTVTVLGGGPAYATASHVVFAKLTGSTYTVFRVPRATPGDDPVSVVALPVRPGDLVATEDGIAARGSGLFRQSVYTATWAGQHATVGPSTVVAPFAGGTSFLLEHGTSTEQALHAFAPGAASGTPVFVPPRNPLDTMALSVSHGRAAYLAEFLNVYGHAYVRDVDGGVPGAEANVDRVVRAVGLSGPYAATLEGAGDGNVQLSWGRAATLDEYVTLPGGTEGRPFVSGHRAVVSGGTRSSLVNLRTGRTVDLGEVVATLFGDLLYTADKNGRIVRKNVVTGATRVVYAGIPAGTCGTSCWGTRRGWRLSAWGGHVVFGLQLGAAGRVTGWFDGTTLKAVPALAAGWQAFTYWDGLLISHRAGHGVHLDDLRTGQRVAVDPTGALPGGEQASMDGTVVAWLASELDHRAGVRPVADFLPGHVPSPLYQSSTVPAGFGPGLAATSWRPAWHLSQDGPWSLTLRQGSATGPVVRTFGGTTARGEIAPVWDGTTSLGADAAHGSYHWSLTTGAGTRTGAVFVSRRTPGTPVLNAPVVASDVSSTSTFVVSWSGAPAGYRYLVERSDEGSSFFPVLTTTARSMSVRAQFNTYRFRVRLVDPAGRTGPAVKRTTVVPRDDLAANTLRPHAWRRVYDGRYWHGSQLRTGRQYDSLSMGARGDGLWLIGSKGPSYGKLRVTVNSKPYLVDLYSPTGKFRQVLFKIGGLKTDWHNVQVEVVAYAGRSTAAIDGLAGREPMH